MAPAARPTAFEARLRSLRRAYGEAVPIDDLVEVCRELIDHLRADVTTARDRRVFDELDALARLIRRTKAEIRERRPEDIAVEHIPTANGELDAIVRHLELATGTILDAAERIETLAAGTAPVVTAPLLEAVTSIYEACNFQDISGQRLTKVIATLQTIESRIVLLVEALGGERGNPRKSGVDEAGRVDAHLLDGPQMPDNANSQAEIDALLASLD